MTFDAASSTVTHSQENGGGPPREAEKSVASNSRSRAAVKSHRKRGRFVPQLLFSLTTLLLSLGAVEIAFRYTMGKPWYERVAEEQTATMGKVWHVGELWIPFRAELRAQAVRRQWKQAQADVLAIKRRALDVDARFAMVVFPVLFDLTPKYPLKDVCDEIVRFAEADEIPALTLLPAFMGRDAEPLWISPFDQHPNANGHAIAAESMIPFVERLVRQGADEG